jgi:hypothetical protein
MPFGSATEVCAAVPLMAPIAAFLLVGAWASSPGRGPARRATGIGVLAAAWGSRAG